MPLQHPDKPYNHLSQSNQIANRLPALLIMARKVSRTLTAGWHGRRKAGVGENFWQYRPFQPGEHTHQVDWRRSARDDKYYVREHEWELAHTVWLWSGRSPSMAFKSDGTELAKEDCATIILLALAELLGSAGEKVGYPGLTNPKAKRNIAAELSHRLTRPPENYDLPAISQIKRHQDIILIDDFFSPLDKLASWLHAAKCTGARAHFIQVVDPIEENFPFSGRITFTDPASSNSYIADNAGAWRSNYLDALAGRRAFIKDYCQQLNWSFAIHRSGGSFTQTLLPLVRQLSQPSELRRNFASPLVSS